ncbi:hypothetical protein DFH29DRAFT_754930, partial [Suillus ampliporus]
MAEVARKYHDNLQRANTQDTEATLRHATIQSNLDEIPEEQKMTDPPLCPLNDPIPESDVNEALYSSKAGSAAGIDGIPYEMWKTLHEAHKKKRLINKPSFNILGTLTTVFDDVQTYGVTEKSNFA